MSVDVRNQLDARKRRGWRSVGLEECWVGGVLGWRSVGLEECWVGGVLGQERIGEPQGGVTTVTSHPSLVTPTCVYSQSRPHPNSP